ncbi:MAG: DUF4373 domain-containing protein [Desulfitobacterium sp.]
MARPRKNGLDYFPHDVDATTDPKLEPAILRYGAAAYAFYFVHLEYCYRADDLSVDVSETETGAEMREVIQRKLHISADDYDGILRSLLRHGAFDTQYYTETGHLTSDGIKKRAGKVFEKRMRDNLRYENNVSTIISADISDAKTRAETTQSKEKNSKGKQSIEKTPNSDVQGEKLLDQGNDPNLQERRFAEFWQAYPKKVGKQAALKSWKRIKTTADLHDRIMKAVEAAKKTDQWQRESGRYIPNPATWLNQGRWDDEIEEVDKHEIKYQHNQNGRQEKQSTGFSLTGFHLASDDDE